MRGPRNSLGSQHGGRRVRRAAGERASLRREGGGRIPLRSETRLTGLAFLSFFLSFSSLRKTITHISPETSSRPIDLRKAGAGDNPSLQADRSPMGHSPRARDSSAPEGFQRRLPPAGLDEQPRS